MVVCGKCNTDITCARCEGSGKIREIVGLDIRVKTCPVCEGWGKDRNHKCPKSNSVRTRRTGPKGNVIININNKNKNTR